ncbi:TPA: hypothetical protein SK294_001600 [Yersinia enterocolitica]|nr:hypothetical protein [Yersinia enterocolitica]EKN3846912.1 hypothetical protein [Yersinia enterocolitica]EKN4798024.1 hypothetical protein [Yersinia enterocolitica]HEI6956368.1 hypothetical protein [Yersinia enterocolitica]
MAKNNYAEIAVSVAKYFAGVNNPELAKKWDQSLDGNGKSCPRITFLGLCEDGWVKGIKRGNYILRRRKYPNNKDYAVEGAKIVLANPNKQYLASKLWTEVKRALPDGAENHNQQMTVVIALMNNDLLQYPPLTE